MDALILKMGDFHMPVPGELVEGQVVAVFKNKILLDIGGMTTGMISGREAKDTEDTLKNVNIGDTLSAYVIEGENDEGYIVLSLRKANQEKTWKKFIDAHENSEVIKVKANEANKGGLLLEINGIKGFIPVSQLAPMHYPRVNDADANQILARLQKLIGIEFSVKIINIDKENGKLILSERAAMEEQRRDALKQLNVGDTVKGRISGIVKFGIFVAFDGLEGLVHISEIAWGHVKNPADYGKLGDEVEVQVIGVDGDKISLSMKRLVPDPWLEAAKMYKIGSIVEGEVNRMTPFGVFVKLNDEINGLIHVTEISEEPISDPSQALKLGDVVKAKVIAVEPDEHRVGLSIKALTEKKKSVKKKKVASEESSKEEAVEAKSDVPPETAGEVVEAAAAEEKEKKVVKKKAVRKKAKAKAKSVKTEE
ncbi:S1 RNA-binding domain-containing protein [Patescibacteria group bacterium]|nr:S1 RNA-binding domain-containing protein [Patescibacteria group bacterium]